MSSGRLEEMIEDAFHCGYMAGQEDTMDGEWSATSQRRFAEWLNETDGLPGQRGARQAETDRNRSLTRAPRPVDTTRAAALSSLGPRITEEYRRRAVEKRIIGALKCCTDAHGAITPDRFGSAAKRVASALEGEQ